jgi:hypothetical protein
MEDVNQKIKEILDVSDADMDMDHRYRGRRDKTQLRYELRKQYGFRVKETVIEETKKLEVEIWTRT